MAQNAAPQDGRLVHSRYQRSSRIHLHHAKESPKPCGVGARKASVHHHPAATVTRAAAEDTFPGVMTYHGVIKLGPHSPSTELEHLGASALDAETDREAGGRCWGLSRQCPGVVGVEIHAWRRSGSSGRAVRATVPAVRDTMPLDRPRYDEVEHWAPGAEDAKERVATNWSESRQPQRNSFIGRPRSWPLFCVGAFLRFKL